MYLCVVSVWVCVCLQKAPANSTKSTCGASAERRVGRPHVQISREFIVWLSMRPQDLWRRFTISEFYYPIGDFFPSFLYIFFWLVSLLSSTGLKQHITWFNTRWTDLMLLYGIIRHAINDLLRHLDLAAILQVSFFRRCCCCCCMYNTVYWKNVEIRLF